MRIISNMIRFLPPDRNKLNPSLRQLTSIYLYLQMTIVKLLPPIAVRPTISKIMHVVRTNHKTTQNPKKFQPCEKRPKKFIRIFLFSALTIALLRYKLITLIFYSKIYIKFSKK